VAARLPWRIVDHVTPLVQRPRQVAKSCKSKERARTGIAQGHLDKQVGGISIRRH